MSGTSLSPALPNASPAGVVLGKLDGVLGRGPTWRAICPAHESKHRTRSLSVREESDGRLLLHCFSGCSVEAIVGALGLDLADLFPPRPGSDEHRAPRVRKPWRAGDVVAALKGELTVALVILSDVAQGKTLTDAHRERAGIALRRIAHFVQELDHAN